MSIMQVPCEAAGELQLVLQQYRPSGGGYLKAAVFGQRGRPITAVALRTSGAVSMLLMLRHAYFRAASCLVSKQLKILLQVSSTWLPMRNTYGAIFELSNLPSLPIDIQITNTDGQTVIAP